MSEFPMLNLPQLMEMKADEDGNIRSRQLMRALMRAGLPETTAVEHAAAFFTSFDKLNKGKLPLEMFLGEYKRMVTFQVVFALRQKASESKDEMSFTKDDLQHHYAQRIGQESAEEMVGKMFGALDADSNGSLSVSELNSWYFQVAAEMKKTREANLTATAADAFKKFDKDGNGFLDLQELGYLTSSLGETLDKTELQEALESLDSSGDGKISFEEFSAWFFDSGREHTQKSTFTTAKLRAKLKLTKGRTWLQEMVAKDLSQKHADTHAVLSLGEFEDVISRVNVQYTDTHKVDDNTLAELKKEADINVVGTVDIVCEDAKSAALFERLAETTVVTIVGENSGRDGPKSSYVSREEGNVVRVNLGIMVSALDSVPIDQVAPMLSGVDATWESAWSPDSVLANLDNITVSELLKTRLILDINGLPEEAVQGLAGMVAGQAAGAVGMEPSEIPVLGDLANGKGGEVVGDAGELLLGMVDGMMGPMLEEIGLPGAFKDQKVRDLFNVFLYGPELPKLSADGFVSGNKNNVAPILFLKSLFAIGAHHIKEVTEFRLGLIDGRGVNISLNGLGSVSALSGLFDALVFPEGPPVHCENCGDSYFKSSTKKCGNCNNRICNHSPECANTAVCCA